LRKVITFYQATGPVIVTCLQRVALHSVSCRITPYITSEDRAAKHCQSGTL